MMKKSCIRMGLSWQRQEREMILRAILATQKTLVRGKDIEIVIFREPIWAMEW